MAKSKEELNKIKEEVETVSKKLHELTDEELDQVVGGRDPGFAVNVNVSVYGTVDQR